MPENMIMTSNITVAAREIDFVTRFNRTWEGLRDVMGIARPIKKSPGTKLVSGTAKLTLQSGDVAEGAEVPNSPATITPKVHEDLTIKKYAKQVTLEAVEKYGAAVAIEKTDEAFLNELQGVVMTDFYSFLKKGTLTSSEATFQMACAMAIGKVTDKFKKLRLNHEKINLFVNTLDVYRYLGGAQVTMQKEFGMTYIENYLGAEKVFVTSEIEEGTVIAVPSDNIVMYYVDPSNSDFAQLGLKFTTQGETSLIGFHAEGVYNNMTGKSYAIMGLKLWAEYIDGIAVVSITGTGA